jgi:glycosyltransferase involved in cell wall biosynthesis
MYSFSIIVCTYNPDDRTFERLLISLLKLNRSDIVYEIIIVDNNSSIALLKKDYVNDYIKLENNTQIIIETNPGLTSARIAGIKSANYEWLVFFDDDNEPNSDYLIEVQKVIDRNPVVGAWGPGIVNVEYLGPVETWYNENKAFFQERHERIVQFAASNHWQHEYPFGTGLIIKAEIAKLYALEVENNNYSVSDRKGKSLSSGGDVQMVLTGIKLGFAAGVSPDIKMNHIISENKTNFGYIIRLVYGTSSSYVVAFNEVYPMQKIPFASATDTLIIRLFLNFMWNCIKTKMWRSTYLNFIQQLGEVNARYVAFPEMSKPFTLRFIEYFLT